MKNIIAQVFGLFIAICAILSAVSLLTGCISIKQADIKDATFNTAGWKSNAGSDGSEGRVDAVTTPTTDVSVPLVP